MKVSIDRTPGARYVFDRQVPVFNIYYPMQWDSEVGDVACCGISAWSETDMSGINSVALYFHFPFCETICNFCPFTRGKFGDRQIIADYLDALIAEISRKSMITDLKALPVSTIFVGGGTPSLLTAEEIDRFGETLHHYFNLTNLKEFSFECEVKSVTEEKVRALSRIGVTNARFGLQSFDPYWRDMFDLTASLDQIYEACDLFNQHLKYTSFDILYGMNGHTEAAFIADLEKAVSMGNTLVDVYPIDNVVTQTKLHAKTAAAGHPPLTAATRFQMNRTLREFMRTQGFMPHNGHGFVKSDAIECARNPVVTNQYTFDYHEHVYGYSDTAVVGFGVNAISILPRRVLTNTNNRLSYINAMKRGASLPAQISRHDAAIDESRPLVTRLPYHGSLEKSLVSWDTIPPETLAAIDSYIDVGLLTDDGDTLNLTRSGWEWYVNMMYCALPLSQKKVLDGFIIHNLRQKGRDMTTEQIQFHEMAVA